MRVKVDDLHKSSAYVTIVSACPANHGYTENQAGFYSNTTDLCDHVEKRKDQSK
jgi:hypothetical protein